MKITVREGYPDEGPEESDLIEQVELDVRRAMDTNIAMFRDAVMKACPQATVVAKDIEVKDVKYWPDGSLTVSVRQPMGVMLPSSSDRLEEAIDDAVVGLEPVGDRYGYLQGLEWLADWDDKSTLAYTLESVYKKER